MTIPFGWTPLPSPLAVVGVVGLGPLAAPLLARAEGTPLRVVEGPDITVLLGPADDLPFLDGVIYLGQNPRAPGLFHPPMIVPDVEPSLVLAALGRSLSVAAPLACLPWQRLVVSLAHAAAPRSAPLLPVAPPDSPAGSDDTASS